MSSLEGRNAEKVLKRTVSLPLKLFSKKINKSNSIKSKIILRENSEFLRNSGQEFEFIKSNHKVDDFLGDRREINDLENILKDISTDTTCTDIEFKEEIFSILNNKKKIYSSNILDCKLLIGEKTKGKFSYTKSNSLNQTRNVTSHEIPKRISRPIFNSTLN
jgi:hypothetical protein